LNNCSSEGWSKEIVELSKKLNDVIFIR